MPVEPGEPLGGRRGDEGLAQRELVRGEPGSSTADPTQITKSIKALREAAPSGGGGTTVKAEGTGGGGQ